MVCSGVLVVFSCVLPDFLVVCSCLDDLILIALLHPTEWEWVGLPWNVLAFAASRCAVAQQPERQPNETEAQTPQDIRKINT